MRLLTLTLLLCLSLPAAAQDAGLELDASVAVAAPVAVPAGVIDAGIALEDGGVIQLAPISLDVSDAFSSAKNFYVAAKTGQWALAFAVALWAFIAFMRVMGKRVHAWLPDDSIWDKPFFFLFETKIGGWLMNWLTAIGAALFTAYEAKVPMDGALWKTAFMASTGATVLVELKDDIMEWWQKRKEKEAAEAAAKATALLPLPVPSVPDSKPTAPGGP